MKGISPIVASVLLILVAVSLVSTYTIWSNRVFSRVSEQGGEEISSAAKKLFSDFNIEGISKQTIAIRNTGSSKLTASALTVFFDGEPITFAADFDALDADQSGSLALKELWKFGPGSHTMKVSAGSFSDSMQLTLEPASGLAGDWRFDESTGTVAKDSSGNGVDGTLNNATGTCGGTACPSWTRGKVNNALEFDGVGDSVIIPKSSSHEPMNTITIEAWFKPDVLTGTHFVLHKGGLYYIRHSGGTLEAVIYTGGVGSWVIVEGSIKTGEWHHITLVYDKTAVIAYLNGAEIGRDPATGNIGSPSVPGGLSIGAESGFPFSFFDGTIDEVRIYSDRAYTPDELYVLKQK
ncbi:MAG: LamG domain-containing protein [Candidatus Aenigmarchaeota archaeon]|nr:LamG domain-containing protein [Candidatus Aenigmarchaeota archaeon]